MNITGLPPACGDIPAEVCVTVDAAVGTGVISADVAAFDAAAVPALLIAAHKERRACDALDQRCHKYICRVVALVVCAGFEGHSVEILEYLHVFVFGAIKAVVFVVAEY